MADIDRIMNHEDALEVIKALKRVEESKIEVFEKPTLRQNEFITGSEVNILDYIDGFIPSAMSISGDISANEDGNYITIIFLKNLSDKWSDTESASIGLSWMVGTGDDVDTSFGGANEETFKKIVKMADDYNLDLESAYGWSIGDKRTIYMPEISSGTYNPAMSSMENSLVIVDKSHYNLVNHPKKKSSFVITFTKTMQNTYYMHGSTRSYEQLKWPRVNMCNYTLDVIYSNMPEYIKEFIKDFEIPGKESQKMSLFSLREVIGDYNENNYSTNLDDKYGETYQIEYFKVKENRIPEWTRGASSSPNWTRTSQGYNSSTGSSYGAYFCGINNSTGEAWIGNSCFTQNPYDFRPFFCI